MQLHDALVSLLHPVVTCVAGNPVLLKTKRVTIFYYGLWMGAAFCAAKAVALYHLSHQHDLGTVQRYFEIMSCYMFPAGVIGARACSWALEDDFAIRKVFRPGFWWHGGCAGVLLGVLVGTFIDNLPFLPLLDAFGLAMPAFESLNRVGCLSYGCCWGRVVPTKEHPHAIRFCNQDSCIHRKHAGCKSEWLYPVQVYAVLLSMIQLYTLSSIASARTAGLQPGCMFLLGMVSSSLVRLVCEQFRGDFRGSGVASTQVFALGQILVALALTCCTTASDATDRLHNQDGVETFMTILSLLASCNYIHKRGFCLRYSCQAMIDVVLATN